MEEIGIAADIVVVRREWLHRLLHRSIWAMPSCSEEAKRRAKEELAIWLEWLAQEQEVHRHHHR